VSIERIDDDLCDGCKICCNSCPMDILRFDEKQKKVIIQYREECICCFNCELDCPTGAIYVSPHRLIPILHPWG